ncbi:sigma-54 interaction domain-containing protein [Eubacterium sp.]|uniref:sigma-54 interaction domain-containing protein n=1 Tax=Eubacterium sp. TaxID=142586 RepID=UPI002FC7CE71
MDNHAPFDQIIGDTPPMRLLKSQAKRIAQRNSTILILGETGSGKGLLAKSIHEASPRCDAPFVSVNCGSIPENLIESELFGYVRGAFTGALKMGKQGKFSLANHGTIFLDEIGEMPLQLQVSLLHVLQSRMVEPIGSNSPEPVDIRVIAATNRDLESMVQSGFFRKDLYFRLGVIPLHIPPLRERRDDIPLLSRYIFEKLLERGDFSAREMSPAFLSSLRDYSWNGNIRELENVIEYALNLCETDILDVGDLPEHLRSTATAASPNGPSDFPPAAHSSAGSYKAQLQAWEHALFSHYLDTYGSSTQAKKEIAKVLDIGTSTLYRKLSQLGLG